MKDTRTYITLHDGMPDHPKIVNLTNDAFRLYIEALCYCSRHLTDGNISPGAMHRMAASEDDVKALVDAGLVQDVVAGFLVHDYLKHQRSSDEVGEMRTRRQAAGRKGGLARAANAQAESKQVLEASSSEWLAKAKQDREPLLKQIASKIQALSVSVSVSNKDLNLLVQSAASDEVIRICIHLLDALVANGVKQPALTRNGWLDPARLMLELDKRTEAQILKAIAFATTDEFWRANILSVSSLRKQYEKLQLKAQASPHKAQASPSTADSWMTYMPGQS